jgi:hypothetical protein
MHPRQNDLLKTATELVDKLAAKESAQTGNFLWKYTDPDGKEFFLKEKKMTVRSPFSGKSFTSKPTRENMGNVSKELREDAKPAAAGGGGDKVTTKKRKTAADWKA